MQLPILSSLTTLFSKVTDEFKSLFTPWSLVAAGIYLFLNGVLLFPLWRQVPALAAVENLETFIQAVAAAFILFGLGYLINTLGGFFVAVANGRLLRGSITGHLLLEIQRLRYGRYFNRLDPDRYGETDNNRAAYRLAYEFPDAGNLSLTRLGNIQAAVADYSVNQYGAHLDTVWPVVETALAKNDSGLIKKVADEQTSMTFLSALAVLLAFTAATAVPLRIWLDEPLWPGNLLIFAALVAGAYVVYRAAALRAAAWGRLVRLTLDLHLKEAETALGLRALEGDDRFTARRERWKAVSEWLVYGGLKVGRPADIQQPSLDWYEKKPAAAPVTLTCSAQLKADAHTAEQTAAPPPPTGSELLIPGPVIEYVIPITHQAAAGEPEPLPFRAPVGGFIRISDSRVPFIQMPVAGTLHRPEGQPETVNAIANPVKGGPDALLWPVARLDYRDSATLIYRLAAGVRLAASGPAQFVTVAPVRSGRIGRLAIHLTVTGPGDITLTAGPVTKERAAGQAHWRPPGGAPAKVDAAYDEAARRASWVIQVGEAVRELFVSLPLADHGLAGPLVVEQPGPAKPSGADLEGLGLDLPGDALPDFGGSPAPLEVKDEKSGQTVRLALSRAGTLKPAAGAARFKDSGVLDATRAGVALDEYDCLAAAEVTALTAADWNNLACCLVWQATPDLKNAYRLLRPACESAAGNDTLQRAIRLNLGLLVVPPARSALPDSAKGPSTDPPRVIIRLPRQLMSRVMRTLGGGDKP